MIFREFVPDFQPDSRGVYRGPAVYRGGDNPSSLAIDSRRRIYYDHATGEGGDVIDFVQRALNLDFRAACRVISGIIGRNVLDDGVKPTRPAFSEGQLAEAELFAVGFRWDVERSLELVKEAHDYELLTDPTIIRRLTQLLEFANAWTVSDAAAFAKALRRTQRKWVAECIAEARETRVWLATILSAAGNGGAA